MKALRYDTVGRALVKVIAASVSGPYMLAARCHTISAYQGT